MIRFDRESWDERYSASPAVWSGHPNAQLVAEVSELMPRQTSGPAPGGALDVGSGEGADSIWLATRGWQVTAVDFSQVALDRGATHAAAAGSEVAERITWMQQDLVHWQPESQSFDLVSAQFMHLPADDLRPLMSRLADAVTIGGTLLIVGHHFTDIATGLRPDIPDMFFTAADLAARLGRGWSVDVAEERARMAAGPDGDQVEINDTVLRATRTG